MPLTVSTRVWARPRFISSNFQESNCELNLAQRYLPTTSTAIIGQRLGVSIRYRLLEQGKRVSEYHGVDSSSFLSKLGNRALRFSGMRKIWDFLFLNVAGYFFSNILLEFLLFVRKMYIYIFFGEFFLV